MLAMKYHGPDNGDDSIENIQAELLQMKRVRLVEQNLEYEDLAIDNVFSDSEQADFRDYTDKDSIR